MNPTSLELREYPSSGSLQSCIAKAVFNATHCKDLRAYLGYYTRQCKQVTSISMTNGTPFPLATNADLLDIIADIRGQASHDEIVEKLRAKFGEATPPQLLQNAIDLATRLLIMIDVGVFNNVYTGRDDVIWTDGTLTDFLKGLDIFNALPVSPGDCVKLGNHFHVYNIERIAGLNVQLTTNLSSVFPAGFAEETLQTLALLFPKGNRQVEKWYRKRGKLDELDFAVLRGDHPLRRIDEYKYWRDRIVILKEAFDDSRPRSFGQWWHDRRDATQWYAVWIAVIFAVFFGLLQSVVGIMQVYKAYHPTPA